MKYKVLRKKKTQEINRIMNVLKNFEGSSMNSNVWRFSSAYVNPLYYVTINLFCKKKKYRELKRLLIHDNPLYYVTSNLFCKKKEHRKSCDKYGKWLRAYDSKLREMNF